MVFKAVLKIWIEQTFPPDNRQRQQRYQVPEYCIGLVSAAGRVWRGVTLCSSNTVAGTKCPAPVRKHEMKSKFANDSFASHGQDECAELQNCRGRIRTERSEVHSYTGGLELRMTDTETLFKHWKLHVSCLRWKIRFYRHDI